MASDNLAVCVDSERPLIGLERYELSVYQRAGEFYASWFCPFCGLIQETSRQEEISRAKSDGMEAITTHHAAMHGASQN
jgi:hypothetical protein